MRFYLGSHRPNWLEKMDVEMMVSRRTIGLRRTYPRAQVPWVLDSGGFTELSTFGAWSLSERRYGELVRIYQAEIGNLAWAAPQDWMCEPLILSKTGLSVREHQRRTVENYLRLYESGLPVVPVLQGWARDDYLRCWVAYEKAGVSLEAEPLVGLGTVCRRQSMTEAEEIVLALQPLRLHGFGMKTTALSRYGYLLASSDSMAWSFGGRLRKPDLHRGCTKRSCANCPEYAVAWRKRVLDSFHLQQSHLDLTYGTVTK